MIDRSRPSLALPRAPETELPAHASRDSAHTHALELATIRSLPSCGV